jgi:hypothetical protein
LPVTRIALFFFMRSLRRDSSLTAAQFLSQFVPFLARKPARDKKTIKKALCHFVQQLTRGERRQLNAHTMTMRNVKSS